MNNRYRWLLAITLSILISVSVQAVTNTYRIPTKPQDVAPVMLVDPSTGVPIPQRGSTATPLSVAQRGGFASAGAGQYGVGLTSATSLTVPTGATIAQICVAGGTANYRDDGTAPTASVGIPWGAGCAAYGGPLATVQFINQTGSTATLSVSYYK